MRIRVRATGMLVEYLAPFVAAADDSEVTLELEPGATIPEVLKKLALPADEPCMVSVDGVLVPTAQRAATAVEDGAVVVVMPPLRGG